MISGSNTQKIITNPEFQNNGVPIRIDSNYCLNGLACTLLHSLVPRRSEGEGRENAWYTLFAHALNFRDISENRILQ